MTSSVSDQSPTGSLAVPSRIERADLPVVVLATATWIGATVARPVPVLLLTALAVGFGLRHRLGGRPGAVLGLVVLSVALAAAASVLGSRSLDGLRPPERQTVDATVVLTSDPETTADGRLRFDARWQGRRVLAEVRAPAAIAALEHRLAGDRAVVRGVVSPFERRRDWATARHLAAELEVQSVHAVGGGAPHAAAANGFRRLLERGAATLTDRHRALLAGLTLGDDRAQPPELSADFRAAGLTHLLAVSGQNVLFLLVVVSPVLRRLRLWPRFVVALAVVAAFALVTRFEPSVVRASVVAGVALWAATTGRPSGGVRHLALAVTGLLLVDPLLTRSVGFRLSVAACIGVLTLAPPIVQRLPGPRWFRETLGVTAGAQLAVAPVLVPTFGAMPLAALPANVAAGPLAGALMVWGVTAGVVAGVVGGPVAWLLHLPSALGLAVLERIAAVGASLPLGYVDLRHVLVLAVATVLWHLGGVRTRVAAAVLVAAVLVAPLGAAPERGPVEAGWAATVWTDGLVAVVDLDTGASAVEVLDVLRRRRVHVVGLLVVRSPRPELAAVVDAISARVRVWVVLAPASSPVGDAVTPRPGFRSRVGGFVVDVAAVEPVLAARIGWARQ